MAIKRPPRRVPARAEASPTLMGNQDTRRKGDAAGRERVLMSFYTTAERRERMRAWAREHETTITRLINEAVDAAMGTDGLP